ncbi:response regulator transcription factor [Paraburkholderia pallida]|uniref:Response regulator transcription factor n=1 Tax=Paraburkholderia pallida TaxID=2547399 RepID=A0A4P7D1S4_9BURK|nr:response regulator transcription factor [Paraburkholderia pallida]QBR01828.1 response regulator transcription factor [Paraburkholderia pallida]
MTKLKSLKPRRDSRFSHNEAAPVDRATIVAIFEDTTRLASYVARTLSDDGYVCHRFRRLGLLTAGLDSQPFDLLILIGLDPDSDAMTALKWVRAHCGADLPVLFIGEPRKAADETAALDAGADDYVLKARTPEVLRARVSSLLRRAQWPKTRMPVRFGPYEFDTAKCIVTLRGNAIALTHREFALAYLLFRQAGLPVSRAQILESIWHQTSGMPSRTVDTHVSWLRTKLMLCPENEYVIIAVYGYGYCLEKLTNA